VSTLGSTREAATYEIRMQGAPPETLVNRFAPHGVRLTSAQTVLMRRVASQDELAGLLDRVLAIGLVLNEVHELRVASTPSAGARSRGGARIVSRAYEVRVDGQLEGPQLRFLQWQHRHLPAHAALSFEGTPEEVHEFLSACCRLGLGVEQVRRVAKASHG
jgi:hypothetical protein